MYKLWVVAQRECSAMVATKAFLFTLVMMPILMFGGIFLMPLLTSLGAGKDQRIVVADATGQLLKGIQAASNARNESLRQVTDAPKSDRRSTGQGKDRDNDSEQNPFEGADYFTFEPAASPQLDDETRLSLSQQIRDGKLYAYVEIPADLLAETSSGPSSQILFVSQDAALSSARQWLASTLQLNVRALRLQKLGVDPELVAQADVPLALVPNRLPMRGSDGSLKTEGGDSALTAIFLPFGVMMLMFLVIFLAAQPMLESGMEEKGQRIAEVLLGSVTPTQLMGGKLLGNVAGSLLIFACYGLGGWFIMQRNGWGEGFPWAVFPWFLVFQVLGVVFFSSLFLTIGASINEMKEAQSLLLPVWLVLMLPMMIWMIVVRDPNGPVAVTLSFFPPSTPLMMILRLASGQTIPAWQAPAAAMLMLGATAAVVYLAGRLYRISLLRTDTVRSLAQLLSRFRSA